MCASWQCNGRRIRQRPWHHAAVCLFNCKEHIEWHSLGLFPFRRTAKYPVLWSAVCLSSLACFLSTKMIECKHRMEPFRLINWWLKQHMQFLFQQSSYSCFQDRDKHIMEIDLRELLTNLGYVLCTIFVQEFSRRFLSRRFQAYVCFHIFSMWRKIGLQV